MSGSTSRLLTGLRIVVAAGEIGRDPHERLQRGSRPQPPDFRADLEDRRSVLAVPHTQGRETDTTPLPLINQVGLRSWGEDEQIHDVPVPAIADPRTGDVHRGTRHGQAGHVGVGAGQVAAAV